MTLATFPRARAPRRAQSVRLAIDPHLQPYSIARDGVARDGVSRLAMLTSALILCVGLCAPGAWAQSATPTTAPASTSEPAADPARQLLADKCVQCHGDSMWRDIRQDQRGWTAALYRMVGRGAIWSEGEINTLAQYLATHFGPSANSSAK